jgi:salicylic acid 3-hydroxylase
MCGTFSVACLDREIVSADCREVRLLGLQLLGVISLSLGLEEDYIEKVLGEQEQHMAVNYYPQFPEPDLTYGLPKHTDPNALTILLQDPKVAGLQVLKDGNRWIFINLRPNALVVNLGDQLQVMRGDYILFFSRYVYVFICVRVVYARRH